MIWKILVWTKHTIEVSTADACLALFVSVVLKCKQSGCQKKKEKDDQLKVTQKLDNNGN